MLIKSTFIFRVIKMTYLPHPFLRKLKCSISFVPLRSSQCLRGMGEGQGGSTLWRWSIRHHHDEVLSPGASIVGRALCLLPQVSLLWRWFKAGTSHIGDGSQLLGPDSLRLEIHTQENLNAYVWKHGGKIWFHSHSLSFQTFMEWIHDWGSNFYYISSSSRTRALH